MLHRLHLGGDVGEDTVLSGDVEALAGMVEEMEELGGGLDAVGDWVDADDGVSGAEEEAARMAAAMPVGRVSWVVWLEAGGETSGEADGGAKAGDDADAAGDEDEVLDAHEFGDGGGDLGDYAWGEGGEAFRRGLV